MALSDIAIFTQAQQELWQGGELLNNNEFRKIWLSAPPIRSKEGVRVQYKIRNKAKGKKGFVDFFLRLKQTKSVDFLFNDNEHSVELIFSKKCSALFLQFIYNKLEPEQELFPDETFPMLTYWQKATVNIYY